MKKITVYLLIVSFAMGMFISPGALALQPKKSGETVAAEDVVREDIQEETNEIAVSFAEESQAEEEPEPDPEPEPIPDPELVSEEPEEPEPEETPPEDEPEEPPQGSLVTTSEEAIVINVSVSPREGVYGGTLSPLSFVMDPFIPGITYIITYAGTLLNNVPYPSTTTVPNQPGVYTVTLTITGTLYEGSGSAEVKIYKKPVTWIAGTAENKEYNGSAAAIKNTEAVLTGLVGSDIATMTPGAIAFENKNAGNNKAVFASGYGITGTDAWKYEVAAQPGFGSARITKKNITIASVDPPPVKVYDASPYFEPGEVKFSGLVTGETLVADTDYGVSAYYTGGAGAADAGQKNEYIYSVNIRETEAADNYSLYPSFMTGIGGVISKAPAPVDEIINYTRYFAVASQKRSAPINMSSYIPPKQNPFRYGTVDYVATKIDDEHNIIESPVRNASWESPFLIKVVDGVETGQTAQIEITVSSTNYGDFKIVIHVEILEKTRASVGVIPPADVTYGGEYEPYATAVSEEVDEEIEWFTEGAKFVYTYSGVNIKGEIYNTPAIKPTEPGSYTVTATLNSPTHQGVSGAASFTINKKTLSWTAGTAANKPYDGLNTASQATPPGINGVVDADDIALDTAGSALTFADVNAADNIAVTATGYGIKGTDVWKYNLPLVQPGFGAANITKKNLTMTAEPLVKTYDGYLTATPRSVSFGGLVGDSLVANTDYTVLAAFTGSANAGAGNRAYTYTVTLLNTAKANNYNLVLTTYSGTDGTINKADAPSSVEQTLYFKENVAASQSVSLSALLPARLSPTVYGTVSYSVSGIQSNGILTAPAATGSVPSMLTVGVNNTATTDKTATITITVTSVNYGDFNITIKVEIIDKEIAVVTVASVSDITYGGILGDPVATAYADGGIPQPYSFDMLYTGILYKESDNVYGPTTYEPTDPGSYTVTATLNSATHKGTGSTDFTIARKELTWTAGTVNNRAYDGTAVAAANVHAALDGIINSDMVMPKTGSLSFATPNVGVSIAVTATGYGIEGDDSWKYVVSGQPGFGAADITKAVLAINTVEPLTKVYDGTPGAVPGSVTFNGEVNGETLAAGTDYDVAAAFTGDFNASSVGNKNYSYTVTLRDTAKSSNYSLTANTKTGTDGTINKAPPPRNAEQTLYFKEDVGGAENCDLAALLPSVLPAVYGTVSYSITAIIDAQSILTAPGSTGTLAGATLAIDVKSSAKTGNKATITLTVTSLNYENFTIAVFVEIIDKEIATVTVTAISNITYGGVVADPVASATAQGGIPQPYTFDFLYTGVLNKEGDNSYGPTTNKPTEPGSYTVAAVLNSATHKGEGNAAFTIGRKTLAWNAGTANNKPYDGNTSATAATAATLGGIINNDTVIPVTGSLSFASPNAGTAISIAATGYGIAGSDAWKYVISGQPGFGTASITKAELRISSVAPLTKTYDGTLNAVAGAVAFTGEKNGETLAAGTDYNVSAAFTGNANAGTGKNYSYTVTLRNTTKANNYTLLPGGNTGNDGTISKASKPADVTRTLAFTAEMPQTDRSCDLRSWLPARQSPQTYGEIQYSVATITGDSAILAAPVPSGIVWSPMIVYVKADLKAGDAAVITVAVSSDNYLDFSIIITVEVTPKPYAVINITAPANITYGSVLGNPSASATPVVAGAEYDITYTGILSNTTGTSYGPTDVKPTDPGTYTVTASLKAHLPYKGTGSANFSISKRTLSWNAGTASNKVYNGNRNAAAASQPTLAGVLSGDNVTVINGTLSFANANAANNIAVTATGYSAGGAQLWKYNAPASQPGFGSANITRATLTIATVAPLSKTYNGTLQATPGAVTFSGLVSGETFALGTDYSVSAEFVGNPNASPDPDKSYIYNVTLRNTARANNYTLPANTRTGSDGVILKASAPADVGQTLYFTERVGGKEDCDLIAVLPARVSPAVYGTVLCEIDDALSRDVNAIIQVASIGDGEDEDVSSLIVVVKNTCIAGNSATIAITVTSMNYQDFKIIFTVEIIEKNIATVTVSPIANVTYGTALADPVVAVSPANQAPYITLFYTGSDRNGTEYNSSAKPVLPGSYTVTATLESTTHKGSGSATFTIRQRALSWSAGTAANRAYNGGSAATSVVQAGLTGRINNDDVTQINGSLSFANANAANNIPVTATGYGVTGMDSWKYIVPTTQPSFGTANITKREISISSVAPLVKEYDGTMSPPAPGTVTFAGLVPEENLAFNTDYTVSAVFTGVDSDVGAGKAYTYTVALRNTARANNYNLANGTVSRTDGAIIKAPMENIERIYEVKENETVQPVPYSIDIGSLLPMPASPRDLGPVTYSLYYNSADTLLSSISRTAGELRFNVNGNQGTGLTQVLTVTVTSKNFDDFDIDIFVVTISKTPVRVSGVNLQIEDKVYDGLPFAYTGEPVFRLTSDDNTDITGEIKSYDVFYESTDGTYSGFAPPVNAGSYRLTIRVSVTDINYSGSRSFDFTISKKPVTVTAGDLDVVMGEAIPPGTVSYSGFIGSDNEGNALEHGAIARVNAADSTVQGEFVIDFEQEAYLNSGIGANYELLHVNGTLKIWGYDVNITSIALSPPHVILADRETEVVFTAALLPLNEAINSYWMVDWSFGEEDEAVRNKIASLDPQDGGRRATVKVLDDSAPRTLCLVATYDGRYTATATIEILPGGGILPKGSDSQHYTVINVLQTGVTVNPYKVAGGLLAINISNVGIMMPAVTANAELGDGGTYAGYTGSYIIDQVQLFTRKVVSGKNVDTPVPGAKANISSADPRYVEIFADTSAKTTSNVRIKFLKYGGDPDFNSADWVEAEQTFKLTISKTYPKINLSVTGSLNLRFDNGAVTLNVSSPDGVCTVDFSEVKGINAAAMNHVIWDDGIGAFILNRGSGVTLKAGSYKLYVPVEVKGYNTAYAAGKIPQVTVKVINAVPKIKLSAGSVALSNVRTDVDADAPAVIRLASNDKAVPTNAMLDMIETAVFVGNKTNTGVYDGIELRYNPDKGEISIWPKEGAASGKGNIVVTFKDSSAEVKLSLTVTIRAALTVSSKTKSAMAYVGAEDDGIVTVFPVTINAANVFEDDWKISRINKQTESFTEEHALYGAIEAVGTADANEVLLRVISQAKLDDWFKATANGLNNNEKDKKIDLYIGSDRVNPDKTIKLTLTVTNKKAAGTAKLSGSGKINIAQPGAYVTATLTVKNTSSAIDEVKWPDGNVFELCENYKTGRNTFTIQLKPERQSNMMQAVTVYPVITLLDGQTVSPAVKLTPVFTASKAMCGPAAVTLHKAAPYIGSDVTFKVTTPNGAVLGAIDLDPSTTNDKLGFGYGGLDVIVKGEDERTIVFEGHKLPEMKPNSKGGVVNLKSSYNLKFQLWAEGTYRVDDGGNIVALTNAAGKIMTKPTIVTVKVNINTK